MQKLMADFFIQSFHIIFLTSLDDTSNTKRFLKEVLLFDFRNMILIKRSNFIVDDFLHCKILVIFLKQVLNKVASFWFSLIKLPLSFKTILPLAKILSEKKALIFFSEFFIILILIFLYFSEQIITRISLKLVAIPISSILIFQIDISCRSCHYIFPKSNTHKFVSSQNFSFYWSTSIQNVSDNIFKTRIIQVFDSI